MSRSQTFSLTESVLIVTNGLLIFLTVSAYTSLIKNCEDDFTKLPQARNENIVVQQTGKELLIYDLTTDKVCSLNETSALVYLSCDGEKTSEELNLEHRFTDDLIYLTLDGLKKANLIGDEYQSKFTGLSRREIIKKVGLSTMTALPVISALIAPQASDAQSIARRQRKAALPTTIRKATAVMACAAL